MVWFCFLHALSADKIDLLIELLSVQFSSVIQWCPDPLRPRGLRHARLPCPSPTSRAYSNSCPLIWWCYPTSSSSVIPFSSHLQSFPASESFQMSQSFTSGGQSIGASASASVLPMNIQDRFPLGWTGWLSLQSKGLSRVFSNTTVQKCQFFGAQQLVSFTLLCSVMSNSATLWTAAYQGPLFMEFSRQDYWSGLPFPTLGDLPHPGIEPTSLESFALADEIFLFFLTTEPAGKPKLKLCTW